MRLKSLRISNIGRFVGDHFIDIESLDDIFQVDGKNENTGGSSGAGKTTVFNSLDYLLGVNDIPTTILQSRLTKAPMAVEGVFEIDNELYNISRSKSSGLTIKSPKGEISGSSKVSEEELDRLIGMPRELLRPTFHKRQNEGGFFLSKTPKEIDSFLSACLDLGSFTAKSDKASAAIKTLTPEVLSLKEKIASKTSLLSTLQQTVDSLQKPVKPDLTEDALSFQKDKVENAAYNVSFLEEKLRARLSLIELNKPTPPAPPEKPSSLALLEAKLFTLRSDKKNQILLVQTEIRNLNASIEVAKKTLAQGEQAKVDLPRLDKELMELKSQIGEIKSHKCPTCSQDMPDGQNHPSLSKLIEKAKLRYSERQLANQKLMLIEDANLTIKNLTEQLEPLKKKEQDILSSNEEMMIAQEISQINEKYLALKAEIAKQATDDLSKHFALINQVNAEYAPLIEQTAGQLNLEKEIYLKIETQLNAYNRDLDNFTKNTKNVNDQIIKTTEELSLISKSLEEKEKQLALAENSVRLIKSYTKQLFLDTLVQIAEKATSILMKIPNMETACLSFDVSKETKSGSVKEEVNAILSVDGEASVPVKSLSGGEGTSIALAVDLAVISTIEERTGKGLNLFILDEPFNGLDTVCKSQCLEILQNHGTNKKIGIVDHSNETKELVSSKVTVARNGQESRIL